MILLLQRVCARESLDCYMHIGSLRGCTPSQLLSCVLTMSKGIDGKLMVQKAFDIRV